jgi:hypothetical protein
MLWKIKRRASDVGPRKDDKRDPIREGFGLDSSKVELDDGLIFASEKVVAVRKATRRHDNFELGCWTPKCLPRPCGLSLPVTM